MKSTKLHFCQKTKSLGNLSGAQNHQQEGNLLKYIYNNLVIVATLTKNNNKGLNIENLRFLCVIILRIKQWHFKIFKTVAMFAHVQVPNIRHNILQQFVRFYSGDFFFKQRLNKGSVEETGTFN